MISTVVRLREFSLKGSLNTACHRPDTNTCKSTETHFPAWFGHTLATTVGQPRWLVLQAVV